MISDYQALQALCRTNFGAFTQKSFGLIEPGTALEYSWHLECVSEHLQAVHDGEIQWLIINQPPRTLKSVQVAQIFPAWEMGLDPTHQFIGASYAHTLAERNVMKCRQIMQHDWYLDTFPRTRISGDQNQKDYFTTTLAGQYKGTGIGGTVTGFGCFAGDVEVMTDGGLMRIEDIKLGINANQVLSYNHISNKLEWKDIQATRTLKSSDIYDITTASGERIRCTGNHPFFTPKGYVAAEKLREGEKLVKSIWNGSAATSVSLLREGIPESSVRSCKDNSKGECRILLQPEVLQYQAQQGWDKAPDEMSPVRQRSEAPGREGEILQLHLSWAFNKNSYAQRLQELWRKVCPSVIKKAVLLKVMCRSDAFAQNAWRRKPATQGGSIQPRIILQEPAPVCNKEGWGKMRGMPLSREAACPSYRPQPQEQCAGELRDSLQWMPHDTSQVEGDTVSVVRRVCTESIPVYDLQVADNENFFANGILVHNCRTLLIDDPLNPKEAASDTVRVNTINEVRSTLFSRFNKYSEGRLVLIMQRLHEMDTAGDLLKDGGYHLLKLPAENRSGKTISIGLRGKEWKMETGDYLSPRLTEVDLAKLRTDLTEYHFLGQYMQEPVPLGGGEFKEAWLQFYQSGGVKPKEMNLVILVDPAGGDEMNRRKKKLSDWTVMDVIGLGTDNNYYLLDRIRDRLNPTERIDTLFMLHRKWNNLAGKPPKVGYEKYGMMTDTHYIREKQRQDAYNFPIVELGGQVMKEERIRRLIPDMQNGRWFFPATLPYVDQEGRKFDMIEEMKGEMKSFPRARWDDILDTMSRVYEPELFLTFPRSKTTMTQRAIARASYAPAQSWEDF